MIATVMGRGGLALLPALSVLAAGCAPPVNSGNDRSLSHEVSLSARISKEGNGPMLYVQLFNGTSAPLVVDRELVFCLGVAPLVDDGMQIMALDCLGTAGREAEARKEEIAKRLVKLMPGRHIERRIDLHGGFVCFSYGYSEAPHARMAYGEDVFRLPPEKKPSLVRVSYRGDNWFDAAFKAYTGADVSAVRLFKGPLQCDVRWPAGE